MASKKDEGEAFQPPFPALHQCVNIDSRHGSRVEINKDLKASHLFENLIEAKSIDDGMRVVESHAVDACFLGPSLSLEKASAFLRRAAKSSYSKDITFVSLVPIGHPYKNELEVAGAHAIIEFPCSKAKFTEAVVRGVIKANKNSPWTGILLNAEQNNINLFAEPGYGKDGKKIEAEPAKETKTQTPMLASLNISSLVDRLAPEMHTLIADIDSDGFDLTGKPSEKVAKAIAKLVDSLMATGANVGKSEKFRSYFEAALNEWFVDLKQLGPQSATSELKRKLRAFTE